MTAVIDSYWGELRALSRYFLLEPGPRGSTEFSVSFGMLGRTLQSEWQVPGYDRTKFRDPGILRFISRCAQSRVRCAEILGTPWSILHLDMTDRNFWVDFDEPPWFDREQVTDTGLLLDELSVFRRSTELIPTWIKSELAVAGYWSVDEDRLTWDDAYLPSGRAVTREVAEAAFAGQRPVAEVLFGADGPPVGFSRDNPLHLPHDDGAPT